MQMEGRFLLINIDKEIAGSECNDRKQQQQVVKALDVNQISKQSW
jgi:hypothetical protein